MGAQSLEVGLTAREWEIVDLWKQAMASKEIAARLGISSRTVDVHIGHIIRKTGGKSMRDAVRILEGGE